MQGDIEADHTMISQAGLNNARRRLLRMHYESGVGHVGGNLSCIDALTVLYHDVLREQDRFILSKGHSAGAWYVALWSSGRLSDDDLTSFHQDDTLLPGHPPAHGLDGVAFATGSLGHGLSLAAGTALGLRLKSSDARVFCLTSDGEWQEGSTWEALVFAVHHGLANLTVLVDHNELQGFGSTSAVASMSPLWERWKGFDVEVVVVDGHDADAIRGALGPNSQRPRLVALRTVKGKGVRSMENRMDSHYLALSAEQYRLAMNDLAAS